MKKVLALMLALVVLLSLASCGGGDNSSSLKVGDTAVGKLCDVTVKSVEFVDEIKDGFLHSTNDKDTYEDITAEDGYAIAKISYSIAYKGKDEGEIKAEFTLDYDGYTFDDYDKHALPKESSGIGFTDSYDTDAKMWFEIDDPLAFKGENAVWYIIVNDEVETNTEKPLLLKVNVPTSVYNFDYSAGKLTSQTKDETFTFTVR